MTMLVFASIPCSNQRELGKEAFKVLVIRLLKLHVPSTNQHVIHQQISLLHALSLKFNAISCSTNRTPPDDGTSSKHDRLKKKYIDQHVIGCWQAKTTQRPIKVKTNLETNFGIPISRLALAVTFTLWHRPTACKIT